MIENVCEFIAGIEADPFKNVFPDGVTVGEYFAAMKQCRDHAKDCQKCYDAVERICEKYPEEYDGPTTTLN